MPTARHMLATLAIASTLLLSGCLDGLNAPQERVVEGSYDTATRYNMTTLAGALSGVQSWEQPRLALRQSIIAAFGARYGSSIANIINTTYGGWITDEIAAFLAQAAPAWLTNLPSAVSVVDAQLAMVDVQTSLLLAHDINNPGSYTATQLWRGITVFRDPACRQRGGLNCPQISVSLEELLDAEYPLDLVNASFVATPQGAASLAMSANTIRFNYGRLALYLMTNLVLPDEPGAGLRLRDVVLAAINCRGLAGRLAGPDNVLGWTIAGVEVGLSLNDLIGTCQEGVFGMINDFVDQFNVPLSMELGGLIGLVDSDRDGTIDQLTSGDIAGTLQTTTLAGQAKEGPVSGVMTGFRVGDVTDLGAPLDDLNSQQDSP